MQNPPALQSATSSSSQLPDLKSYRHGKIRFVQLLLVSLVVFGNQYAFNNPQALQDSFEKDLDINETQFNLLYTVFAFPNIFATFFIGFLIDFLGVRIGIVTLSIGVALFQSVVAVGGYQENYYTILVGRGLFGIASQSLVTAQACMVSVWFTGKELAFALGIAITFPELGNALNSYLSPLIYQSTQSLGTPLLVSVVICVLCAFCAISAAFLDKKAQMQDTESRQRNSQESESEAEQIKCSDVKRLRGSFWLIVVLCMFGVALYVPFMDNVNRMFIKRFCLTEVAAGRYIMVTYITAAAASAPLGMLVDKIGFKRYFIMFGMLIYIMAQGIILAWPTCQNGIAQIGPVWGLLLIGLGYSFYANCIVPAIPLIVKKKVLGTAFGIMQMIESICLAFVPVISSLIVQASEDPTTGYRYSELFFTLLGITALATSFGLFFVSDKVKKRLDSQSKPKKVQDPALGQGLLGNKGSSSGELSSSDYSDDQGNSLKEGQIPHPRRFTLQL